MHTYLTYEYFFGLQAHMKYYVKINNVMARNISYVPFLERLLAQQGWYCFILGFITGSELAKR